MVRRFVHRLGIRPLPRGSMEVSVGEVAVPVVPAGVVSFSVPVGMVAWGRVSVGSVAWVAVGVGMMVIYILFMEPKIEKAKKEAAQDGDHLSDGNA